MSMASLPWILVLLLLHGSHSYILLTANLDDVHAIAKQIAVSPVAGQINRILRRASTIFNQQLRTKDDGSNQHRFRTNPEHLHASSEPLQDNRIERRSQIDQAHDNHHRRSNADQTLEDNSQRHWQADHDARRSEQTEVPLHQELKTNQAQDHETTSDHSEKSRQLSEFPYGHNEKKSNENGGEPLDEDHNRSREEVPRDDKDTKYGQAGVKRSQAIELGGQTLETVQPDELREKANVMKQSDEELRQDKKTRSHTDEVVALGKNASFYLKSMKKIMENV